MQLHPASERISREPRLSAREPYGLQGTHNVRCFPLARNGMENLNQLMDPRKQELLEARFLGTRGFAGLGPPGNTVFNPQASNQDSNLSSTSVGSQPSDSELQQVMRTPPQERKRKRQSATANAKESSQEPTPKRNIQLSNCNSSQQPGQQQVQQASQVQQQQQQQQPDKKISEYFIKNQAQNSPGR